MKNTNGFNWFIKKLFKGQSILLIFLIASQPIFGQTQSLGVPFSKYYSGQEYEGGIQNWRITQNNKGIIYVANNFGLLEYDGTNWGRHILPTSTKLRDVLIGSQENIYVASQGDFGFFRPMKTGQLAYRSLADSLPPQFRSFDETWRIFRENEKLIFCTFNQIFIFSETGNFLEIINPEFDPENFFQVNNKIYINQLEVGLSILNGNKIEPLPGTGFFKGKTITGIIALANQRLWITTLNDGVFIYDDGKLRSWKTQPEVSFGNAAINVAIRLNNGNFAVGTQNAGLYIIDQSGKLIMHLNKDAGIQNRTVLSLFEDLRGNIWVGHNNGISCIEIGLPFRHINEQTGLQGTGYAAFVQDQKLYLGTNNGLYLQDLTMPVNNLSFVKNADGQVYNISKIQDKLLLGHHQGAFELINNEAKQITDLLGVWTYVSLPKNPNYILAGNYKGLLLFEMINNQLHFKRKIAGINESCRVMELEDSHTVWMTHGYKGVYKMQLNEELDSVSVKYYGKNEGFPSNLLINVWRINNRLIFTTEEGIYRYEASIDKFVKDEFFEKYLKEVSGIVKMVEDPLGNVFYISEAEVGVLKKQINGDYKKESSIFNRLNGLLNDDLQNMTVINANQVLFAAKEGFIFYNMAENNITNQTFNTLIRSVKIGFPTDSLIATGIYNYGNEISYEQRSNYIPRIPHEHNTIKIAYSAPLVDPQNKTMYQFSLDNEDDGWSEWTAQTEKEYTNLREGNYTFHVRAKNIYNHISKEATYSFVILPPWYRTPTAYGIYTFLVCGFLFAGFLLLDTRYKKQTARMAHKQKIELKQKDSVLKSTEEKIEELRNEKLKAEINSKNQELATSTMHLINKNEFINSMKHTLTSIIKRSKNQEVKNEIKKIISNIDKNIQQDEDWEHFAIHFDQVHGDFLNHLKQAHPNLSPQEMKLSAYLRMNLSTKEIAQLLNISVRGVEIARYRLRKKLELDRSINLQEYILKY